MGKKHSTDELNDQNFEQYLQDHPVTLMLFYAPWCFYSQQVMPTWDIVAQKLKLHDPPVHVAKIDAHRYGSIGDKYGVQAFPVIKLFVDSLVFDFVSNSDRRWQTIVKWVNERIDRDHVLASVADVDHFLNDNELNVIGMFPDGYNSTSFMRTARHFERVMFAEVKSSAMSSEIAEHVAKHATLVCETIDVGHSGKNVKELELPREGMHCNDHPKNPQRPEWGDRFKTTVTGKKLSVQRSDSNGGWDQLVLLKCCDEEGSASGKQLKIDVPAVVMFMPHDERYAIYEGDPSNSEYLNKWVLARQLPLITYLSETNHPPEQMPSLLFIRRGEHAALEHELREAARQVRGRVAIVFMNHETPFERRIVENIGVNVDELPLVILWQPHTASRYSHAKKYVLPTKGLQASGVVQFVDDFEAGRAKVYVRSEAEPQGEDRIDGHVTVLVGSTFYKAAHDPTKDVLLDFYAPWCGHCRKFEPQYKALAKNVKHVRTLKVAKLDATRNEVEGLRIDSFPTIILFPAGPAPKREIHYQGSRDPEVIQQWLHKFCTHPFDDTPPAGSEKEAAEEPESGLLDPSEEDL